MWYKELEAFFDLYIYFFLIKYWLYYINWLETQCLNTMFWNA